MDNLISSATIVLPLFILMVLGYLLRRLGVIDDDFVSKLFRFIYRFVMPVLLAYNIYTSDLRSDFDLSIIIYAVTCTVVIIALLWITVPRAVADRAKAGVIIQAIYRSNFLLFAVHIMESLYPDKSLGMTLVLVAVMTPMLNLSSVIVLSAFGGVHDKNRFKNAVVDIITNPLVIGSLIGIILSLSGIKLGALADGLLSDIGSLGTPLALIALGGQFKFTSAKKNTVYIVACCVGRLIVAPVLIIGGAILLGFRGMDLGLMIAMAASPVAVTSYIMADQMGCDGKLAGEAVVFSSAFSVLTIFGFVFLLKNLALI